MCGWAFSNFFQILLTSILSKISQCLDVCAYPAEIRFPCKCRVWWLSLVRGVTIRHRPFPSCGKRLCLWPNHSRRHRGVGTITKRWIKVAPSYLVVTGPISWIFDALNNYRRCLACPPLAWKISKSESSVSLPLKICHPDPKNVLRRLPYLLYSHLASNLNYMRSPVSPLFFR